MMSEIMLFRHNLTMLIYVKLVVSFQVKSLVLQMKLYCRNTMIVILHLIVMLIVVEVKGEIGVLLRT